MKNFCRIYPFFAAIMPFESEDWERQHLFYSLLVKKLPKLRREDFTAGLLETIDFDKYRLQKEEERDITLENVNAAVAPVPVGSGGGIPEVEMDSLSRIVEETARIFGRLGFSVVEGPELENRFNNFTALNTPPHHPSQDRTDTFWFGEDCLLRTQTSPVQIRTMMSNKPPVRVICPGRTFRRDTTDATHSANFHQIEGLYVDETATKPVSLADLKSVLAYFAKEMMGDSVTVRFRPHFFPFTEPSVEVDFSCHVCKGKGCSVCKQSGWIEVAGAGMVDPRVFKFVGWDPEKVSGYAFGFGVERLAMIKYGIPDIRWLYENDVRFLDQLG